MPTLYGAPISPFVRKVRVLLAEKNLSCELAPVFPGSDDPQFQALSPLGKIPAWKDEQVGLADSSVICAYLEKRHPTPALYPTDPAAYARALWFEEYADSKIFEVLTAGVFFERVVKQRLRGEPPDEAKVSENLKVHAPALCAYLEGQLSGDYFTGSNFTLGDAAVASQFVNYRYAGEEVDAARYPKLAGFLARVLDRPSFRACLEDEARFMQGAH